MSSKDNLNNPDPEIRYIPVQFIDGEGPKGGIREIKINFVDVFKWIWIGRKTVVILILITSIIGYVYAKSTPNLYSSTVKLLPEVQQLSNVGRLGGLAAQFGLGVGAPTQTNENLPPQIYNEILFSTDFIGDIIKKKVFYEPVNDSITLQDFFNNYQKSNTLLNYTVRLPFKVLALFRSSSQKNENTEKVHSNSSYKRITPLEMGAIGGVRRSIDYMRDQMVGVQTLVITTQSPEVTVQLANIITESLSDYLIWHRTEKARQNLEFLEQRHKEAYSSFVNEQDRLASFRDQNRGTLTAVARTHEQNIQSEYNVKLNIYNSITEQLEQARIKLQQDTPVVSVLQEAVYPNRKSSPNRMRILILFAFLGSLFGVMIVLIKPIIIGIKTESKITND